MYCLNEGSLPLIINQLTFLKMKVLCILLCAIIVALSVVCNRWYKAAHKLVIEKRRVELALEKAELMLIDASPEAIREVTMAIVDFDREHYDELYR